MSFRNSVFPFYFLILGVAAFSFSPGLVLWSGIMGVAGWLGAFAWAVRDMPVRLDWADIGTAPTTEHFLSIFLSPNFVATGSRIQESMAYPCGRGADRRRHVARAAHGAPAVGAGRGAAHAHGRFRPLPSPRP
jgi:hypothetical protein